MKARWIIILSVFCGLFLQSTPTHAFFSANEEKSSSDHDQHFCVFKTNIRRPVQAELGSEKLQKIAQMPPDALYFSPQEIQAPIPPMSEVQFDSILQKMNDFFQPLFNHHGLHLRVVSEWTNDYVTAFAKINDALPTLRMVHISGGMARHEAMSPLALEGLICHEIGHHLGGAPTRQMYLGQLSIEGQADYYTTLKCLRHLYRDENNVAFINEQLNSKKIPEVVQRKCAESFSNPEDAALCVRVSLTANATAQLSTALAREKQSPQIVDPQFDTPSSDIAEKTKSSHAGPQCRLDTFFQGALCIAKVDQIMNVDDPAQGACSHSQGDQVGTRPLCWYKPNSPADDAIKQPIVGQMNLQRLF